MRPAALHVANCISSSLQNYYDRSIHLFYEYSCTVYRTCTHLTAANELKTKSNSNRLKPHFLVAHVLVVATYYSRIGVYVVSYVILYPEGPLPTVISYSCYTLFYSIIYEYYDYLTYILVLIY